VVEFTTLLKSYGVSVAFAMGQNGFKVHSIVTAIKFFKSPHDRSEIYLNFLPALNAGQVRLFDIPRLGSQLLAPESHTTI
jgi:hypothetical protein